MSSSFQSVPVLDYSLSLSSDTKPGFLEQLQYALLEVGFLYIKNTNIDDELIQKVISLGKAFFDLPEEEKLRLEMKNSPHFLGYSRLGNEITKHKTDWREQIDLATELPAPEPTEPRYRLLRGPNQWPSESLLPGFRDTYTTYMNQMTDLSTRFVSLIAEAIGLPPNAFDKFFWQDPKRRKQDKLKIVKYPDVATLPSGSGSGTETQGVGPHKDSMLSSYLLQATNHRGLQVQNVAGEWIECPPIPGTFVVAIGQGLEAMTGGVCVATTHRVLSPPAGSGARFSIPFFQGVSYDTNFEDMDVPEDVKALKRDVQRSANAGESVEMTFKKERYETLGQATLMNRIKSHQDVGEKFYPDLLTVVREMVAKEQEAR
ncbi:Clavaminate synthase-like protein [Terfezia boudieri ATCC MYA-4762]|uniref:Clavaminate synthase-like protein n=1 Tax=Terfezia boudieri ATCC MYA-4762 TaxID=1051890 RepID=A0A3N4LQN0_9PEZI|nr:Clavaminate synthase-like protein [Terfezia boudieri ATCC MYA-4762]